MNAGAVAVRVAFGAVLVGVVVVGTVAVGVGAGVLGLVAGVVG
jgi:hypothetical protein